MENKWKLPEQGRKIADILPQEEQIKYWQDRYEQAMGIIQELLSQELGTIISTPITTLTTKFNKRFSDHDVTTDLQQDLDSDKE